MSAVYESSVLFIEGKQILVRHKGPESLSADNWLVLIQAIKDDLERGKGFYPYLNFSASVEWQILPVI
jgi:hypothetical protein